MGIIYFEIYAALPKIYLVVLKELVSKMKLYSQVTLRTIKGIKMCGLILQRKFLFT